MFVKVDRPNDLFDAPAGRVAEVRREYFYNGETWLALTDLQTGKTFESPAVFWTEDEDAASKRIEWVVGSTVRDTVTGEVFEVAEIFTRADGTPQLYDAEGNGSPAKECVVVQIAA